MTKDNFEYSKATIYCNIGCSLKCYNMHVKNSKIPKREPIQEVYNPNFCCWFCLCKISFEFVVIGIAKHIYASVIKNICVFLFCSLLLDGKLFE